MNREEDIQIIRSSRKTVGITIASDGHIIVKAPARMSERDILQLLEKHQRWIEKHKEKRTQEQQEAEGQPMLTMEEIRKLADEAVRVIPQRVAYYAPRVGVTYGKITIRNQKTRWGSCSAKGNLNFNCLLMLAPPEVLDAIVVHELCHRKEMNHSAKFYEEVLRVYPNYRVCEQWLKEHGEVLMRRMTG